MAFPFSIPNLNFLADVNAPVGSSFQPPQGNPYEALETILNNLNSQPLAQAPQPSVLDRILTGFAQAASVAASNDPGQALSGLISQSAARRDANTQALQQRQNLINQVRVQAGIEQARSLSEEQSRVRQENRANFRQIQGERRETATKIAAEKRALANYRDQKITDLDIAKQEFEQNEELLSRYGPLREARMRHEIIIKDLPQQMERSAAWQAIAELTEAGSQINRNDLKDIGDKLAGVSRVPLTPLERQILNNINEERRTKLDRKFEAEMQKTEAETSYIQQGKPGSLSNAFERGYLGRLGSNMAETLDNAYVRLPNGSIVTPDQARAMGIQGMSAKPLTPEENAAENQKRISQIKQLSGASQAVGQPTNVADVEIERGKRAIAQAIRQGVTTRDAQISFLKANGFADEVISILLGLPVQSGMAPAKQESKPSVKGFDVKEFRKKSEEMNKRREDIKKFTDTKKFTDYLKGTKQ